MGSKKQTATVQSASTGALGGPVEDTAEGCRIQLHVAARASRTQVVGIHDGRVKLQVAAPPVDGAANEAIVRWASKTLGVTREAVVLASGATGKRKTLVVQGIAAAEVRAKLGL